MVRCRSKEKSSISDRKLPAFFSRTEFFSNIVSESGNQLSEFSTQNFILKIYNSSTSKTIRIGKMIKICLKSVINER